MFLMKKVLMKSINPPVCNALLFLIFKPSKDWENAYRMKQEPYGTNLICDLPYMSICSSLY